MKNSNYNSINLFLQMIMVTKIKFIFNLNKIIQIKSKLNFPIKRLKIFF